MEIFIGTMILAIGMFIGQNFLEHEGMNNKNASLTKDVIALKEDNTQLLVKLNAKQTTEVKKVIASVPKVDGIEIVYLGD